MGRFALYAKGWNAVELFKLLGTIAIDNEAANKAIDDTSERAQTSSRETEGAFSKIGGAASKIATGVGLAGAALGGAWIAAIEGTREYRTHLGMLDTAFQTSGHSSDTAKQTYSELNAVLGDSGQATEAAQHLALIADNEDELASLTHSLTGVYATFGESLPLEGLAEGINHSAKLGEVQGSLADALEWSGITVDDFNKQLAACSNEEERQKLIMETLNDTYSKAGTQYKETNKDVLAANKAQEKLTHAFSEFGRVGEPILTAIKEKVAEFAIAAVPHIENFIQKVKDISQWIKENQDTINTWVGVIIGAGTSIGTFLLILNWGSIMAAATKAIQGVRTAVMLFNATLLANPIALIVAALAGLVAGFIYLWNTSDTFRQFWIDLWVAVKEAASVAWTAIVKFFSDAWAKIKKNWSTASSYFKGIWTSITKVFANVKSWFSQKFQQAWSGIKSIWTGAAGFFRGVYSSVTGAFSNVAGWFRSKFSSAWTSVKSAFSGWGSFFGGLWTQIKSKFSSIGTSLGSSMSSAVKSGLNKALSAIEKAINKGIGLINDAIGLANKLPGIDVGKVKKVSLPRLARGGVLEKGQVGLLEGTGAEAVVPLENNRAWLSRVAADLHELQSSSIQSKDNHKIEAMLRQALVLLEGLSNMQIVLDSGVLVGELVPAVDGAMAVKLGHVRRGNVR